MPSYEWSKLDPSALAAFCERWGIERLSVFGSILREDFDNDSDVDLLARFRQGRGLSFDSREPMIEEAEALFGRAVHLVDESKLGNPFRRRTILTTRRVVHEA
jgi:predicted nucleotidyltransferase